MNIINEAIVFKILSTIDPSNDNASIQLLEWTIDENILKAGDNYTSQICRLWITYEKRDVRSSRSYFVKIPINSPTYQIFKTLGSYDEEIIVYTKILPQMYQIEKDYFTPRLYYSDDTMTLILKDLSLTGYKCVDRRQQLDFQHCCQALQSLAKLHALSVVVANKSADAAYWMKYQPEKSGDTDAHKSIMDRIPMYVDSMTADIKVKYPDEVFALKNLTWEGVVADYCRREEDDFDVFCHGDFWTNNILFKYDDEGIVENVKMIDFQFSHWGNPALDIIHFTITSMRFDVYRERFHELLVVYVDTLNAIITKLSNCSTYSTERLVQDITKRYHYACLVMACILPITLADSSEVRGNDDGDSDVWTKTLVRSYRQQLFIDVSNKWFLHFVREGYLKREEKKQDGEK